MGYDANRTRVLLLLGSTIEHDAQIAVHRMLFTCRPQAGHYEPLVPLATAARDAGHAVAFATGEPCASRAREAGFEAFAAGPGEDFRQEWPSRYPEFHQLVGDELRRFVFTEIFANLELEPRADALEEVIEAWRPDVIVHELAELAAPLVGTALGLPYVAVSYGPLIGASLALAAGGAAARHWRARGLEPHPTAGLFQHLYIDTCPPSLQHDRISSIGAVQRLRPAAAVAAETPPAWFDRLAARTIVYLTMGTVWNRDLEVFRTAIEGARDEDVALVVTVGRQNDPRDLGPQPDNVHVHQYIPQAGLLPRCDAVIAHGGAGTTLGALAFGVPLVLLPQGADQHENAGRIVDAGAGRQLLRHDLSTATVREALLDVLSDDRFRQSARRIAAEISDMPEAGSVVERVTDLCG